MLEGIEPSIALTGGPWYTDNELDTEFIQNLTEACYKFISDLVSHHTPPTQISSTFTLCRVFQKVETGPCTRYPILQNTQAQKVFEIRLGRLS